MLRSWWCRLFIIRSAKQWNRKRVWRNKTKYFTSSDLTENELEDIVIQELEDPEFIEHSISIEEQARILEFYYDKLKERSTAIPYKGQWTNKDIKEHYKENYQI